MKRKLLLIFAAICAATAGAQTLSDARVYINPGHGSWGPNDRPMATIPYPNLASTGRPDTCGFYESNTDLWKCLKLGATLEKMGVQKKNIMYSRRQNGPYPYVSGASDEAKYNRSLAEISAEVDANNMDIFISVHSNAATDGTTTNYPLILYRGKDGEGGDYAQGSRDLSKAIWTPHYMDELDPQSAYSRTNMNLRGDIDFYHYSRTNTKGYEGYLGVLMHSVPGCLIEGFFHTYQPARHRALNQDYCGQEGVRIARGICDYLKLTPESTGYIMGTVKDMHQKIANNLFNYAPNTNDQWMPLNGAKVLLKQDGETIATYQVDKLYNGIFVFEDLAPGDYTLEIEAEGYKPLFDEYKKPVTVKANETSYVKLLAEASDYEPPVVVYKNYPDPEQPAYLGVPTQLQFSKTSRTFSNIKGTLKRAIVRGDSAIVLADNSGTPEVHLINLKTNTYTKKISTTGIVGKDASNAGDYSVLSDIAMTADGKLIGVNSVLNQYNDAQVEDGYKRGTLRIYKWDDFDANPTLWVSTQSSANFYKAVMGKSIAVSGESKDCNVITTATTTSTSKGTRMLSLNIVDNTIAATVFTEKNIGNNFSENKQGDDMQLTVSPLADDRFVIDGSKTLPTEFIPAKQSNVDSEITSALATSDQDSLGLAARGVSFFKYAGHSLMAAPYINGTRVAGLRLFDVTGGFDKPQVISINGASSVSTSILPFMSSGAKVEGEDVTLYLFIGNRIVKFTTKNTAQTKTKRISAYDLKQSANSDNSSYTFCFTTNSQPQEASLIFYDASSGEKLDSIAVASPKNGLNSVVVSAADLPFSGDRRIKWAVRLKGSPVRTIARLNSTDASMNYDGSAFCAVDNSTESEYFGRIYVMNYASYGSTSNGLYAYSPAWARLNSSPYRGGQNFAYGTRLSAGDDGKVYLSDYSDDYSGVYVADPANLSGSFTQFFQGERDANGLITYNGVKVGSSTPCVTVENGKMYVLLEDFNNNVGVYNIGTGDAVKTSWAKAPSKTYNVGSLAVNGNGTVLPGPDGGVWVSQLRYLGNNTSGVPSLMYMNASGKVVFNSGNTDFADNLNGSCCGAVAVSRDGKLLVINDGEGVLQFFDVAWNNNVPTLTPKYSYTADVRNTSDHNAIYQMSFDYAGNLVCSGSSLGIYSIPDEANETIVPARSAFAIVNGIESPVVNHNGEVSYNPETRTLQGGEGVKEIAVYDTAGTRIAVVNGRSLSLAGATPGVYIVKVNGNAGGVKILVK